MIRNYILATFRYMLRNKVYTLINILGLAIGISGVIISLLFVLDETSYDKHNEKADRIYRLAYHYKRTDGSISGSPIGPWRMKNSMITSFSEIEEFARLSVHLNFKMKFGDIEFYENEISFADNNIFNVFSFNFLIGKPDNALSAPYTIVLNKTTANKYFGDENPVGKSIKAITPDGDLDFEVTGVFEDIPKHSHFHVNALISSKTGEHIFAQDNKKILENWGEGFVYNYILLKDTYAANQLSSQFKEFMIKNISEEYAENVEYELQPLLDIHLKSHLRGEIEANGDITSVYIFGIIAIFILIIASINYMNLATAQSAKRAREVGLRKIIGSSRKQLVFQFIGEALSLAFLAMLISFVLSELFLPIFNELSGKELELSLTSTFSISFILISLLIGLIAGSYPAFFLSGFKIINVLRSDQTIKSSGSSFRKILVVVQFSISIVLIISTLVIFNQWSYMRNKKLGINTYHILVTRLPGYKYKEFKEEILKYSGIKYVTASNKRPTERLSSNLGYKAEGLDPKKRASIKIVTVDYDFFETFENKIIKGRSFSKDFQTDAEEGIILNEAAVKEIGWDNPIGKWFETSTLDENNNWQPKKGKIIGVAQNFNFESLHTQIQPVCFFIEPNWRSWVSIKVSGENLPETINYLKSTWDKFSDGDPAEFTFLEDDIRKLYENEENFMKVFLIFAGLAIFIACLGVFGLASFTAEQRTKEIGIRKTFGANVSNITIMISYEFLKLVSLSFVIASPIAWYFMADWLNEFPYKISLSWIHLLSGFVIVIVITMLSVTYQALKAALKNPAEALSY